MGFNHAAKIQLNHFFCNKLIFVLNIRKVDILRAELARNGPDTKKCIREKCIQRENPWKRSMVQ